MLSALHTVVSSALPQLAAIPEEVAATKPSPDQWSKKEILGHLIDSAANNHQRFIRLQLEPEISLPGYEPDGWVRLGRYQQTPWAAVIDLWSAYNRHLVAVIESIDDTALGHVWHSKDGDVTLEFIATDYVVHMRHHLQQIGLDV